MTKETEAMFDTGKMGFELWPGVDGGDMMAPSAIKSGEKSTPREPANFDGNNRKLNGSAAHPEPAAGSHLMNQVNGGNENEEWPTGNKNPQPYSLKDQDLHSRSLNELVTSSSEVDALATNALGVGTPLPPLPHQPLREDYKSGPDGHNDMRRACVGMRRIMVARCICKFSTYLYLMRKKGVDSNSTQIPHRPLECR